MRISIRRCLSMLRNTRDGNELALQLPMLIEGVQCRLKYTIANGGKAGLL